MPLPWEAQTGMSTAVLERTSQRLAPRWFLMLHNDDVTPMYYVVVVLTDIMKHTKERASQIMFEAHEQGAARCFDASRERCELALEQVQDMNKISGMKLKVTLESEEQV